MSRGTAVSTPLTVYYGVSGTAANGVDYASLYGSVTIAANQASATVTVTPVDDALVEGNETVTLTITAGAGYTIGSPSVKTATIADNDSLPTVTITSSDSNASEPGTDTATVTVSRTCSTAAALTVTYTVGGTATAGQDYQALPGTLTIPAGAANATIIVTALDDSAIEGSETVQLTLSSGSGYTLGSPANVTAQIADNDLPQITIQATDDAAAEAGPDSASFTLTRNGPTTQDLVVSYTIGGTAAAGVDYTSLTGTAIIAAGSSTAVIVVAPLDDNDLEGPETVSLTVAAGAGYTVGSPSSATATIADNELPVASIEAADASAAEAGMDPGSFTVSRTGPTGQALEIAYSVGGSAAGGADYAALAGTVTIPAGSSSATVTVVPVDDQVIEGSESVEVTLNTSAAYTLGAAAANVAIADNDLPTVTISATDAAAAETGPDGAVFEVTRNGPTTASLTVLYTLAGTATSGTDYDTPSGYIVIPVGALTASFAIVPLDDSTAEEDETIQVVLAATANYDVGSPAQAEAVIDDNDLPTVSAQATDPSAAEADTASGAFTVTRDGPLSQPLVVNYTLGGQASGTDYQELTGTVTIAAGAASASIEVIPVDDTLVEFHESVVLDLSANSAYLVGSPASATLHITDDDNTPPVAVDDSYDVLQAEYLAIPPAGLLSNDTDPDSMPLTTVLVTGPSHGQLVQFYDDGSFVYLPQAAFVGDDVFTYRAYDGAFESLVASVTITVIAGPAPELELLDGPATVPDATGEVSLGTTALGYPLDRTLTVRNTGGATLTLNAASLTLPSGFSVQSGLPDTLAPGISTTFVIRLDAASLGVHGGTASFESDDADESPFEFELCGEVVPPAPEIRVRVNGADVSDGGMVDFGFVALGVATQRTLVIENTGTAELTLDPSSLVMPTGFSVVASPATTVAPGDDTTLVIQASAASAGTFAGHVGLPTNDSDESPFDFDVNAVVIASPEIRVLDGADELLDGGTVSLGIATVGQPVDRSLVIENTGTADLNLNPAALTLPAGFALVSAPDAVVAIGATTTIVVRLEATGVGAYSGEVVLDTNDLDEDPFRFQLSGEVLAPAADLRVLFNQVELTSESSTLDFGSIERGSTVERTLVLENSGTAPLELVEYVIVPRGFRVVSLGTTDLAPGASTTLVLSFDAAIRDFYDGDLVLLNDSEDGHFRITLTGRVLEPDILVLNGGQELLDRRSTLDLGLAATSAPATRTITVSNIGDGSLIISPPTLSSGFSLVGNPGGATLAPGSSLSLVVQLDAAVAGDYVGELAFTTNDRDEPAFHAALKGSVGQPEIQVTLDGLVVGGGVDFGSTAIGLPLDRTFLITNVGYSDLALTSAPTLPAGFSLLAGFSDSILAPGETATVVVRLDALNAGEFFGGISFGTNDADEALFQFTAFGAVAMPEFGFLNGIDSVHFGITTVGLPVARTLTVVNTGHADLVLSEPILLPAEYTLQSGFSSSTVAPGQSATFTVQFDAAQGGIYDGELSFGSNDSNESLVQLPLHGAAAALANFRLWNDTGTSSADAISSDPTVSAELLGVPPETSIHVDVDQTGDGQADAAILVWAGEDFRWTASGLTNGPVTLNARVRVTSASGDITGAWQSLGFTLESGTNAGAIATELALFRDNGVSPSDLTTSDPTITGRLVNDGAVENLLVELDYDGDDEVDAIAVTDASGHFTHLPVGLALGAVSLRVRAVEADYPTGLITGEWATFDFTLAAVATPTLSGLALVRDTGPSAIDKQTWDPTLTGQVLTDGVPRFVEAEFDYNGDGYADDSVPVGADGWFSHQPTGLQAGPISLKVRPIARDHDLAGVWTEFTFTLLDVPGPAISSLSLLNDSGSSATDGITADPTLTGTITSEHGPAFVGVQFDLDGDGQSDDEIQTDEQGAFTWQPEDLEPGAITVRARPVQNHGETGALLEGAWVTISFTLVPPPLPTIEGLGLASDTGSSATDQVTSDPTLEGHLSGEGVLAFRSIEFDLDDDGQPDGGTTTDQDGVFQYYPTGISPGAVTGKARVVEWDQASQKYVHGGWVTTSFTLEVAPSTAGASIPGAADARAMAGDVAAASQAGGTTAAGAAYASHNAAFGAPATASGSIALPLGSVQSMIGVGGMSIPDHAAYGFERGYLPTTAGYTMPWAFAAAAVPAATTGSHSTAINVSGGTASLPNQVTGNLASNWTVTTSGGSFSGTFVIDVSILYTFSWVESGTFIDTSGGRVSTHTVLHVVSGSYSFVYHAAGSNSTGAGGVTLSGTFNLAEDWTYTLDFTDDITYILSAPQSGAGVVHATADGDYAYTRDEPNGTFLIGPGVVDLYGDFSIHEVANLGTSRLDTQSYSGSGGSQSLTHTDSTSYGRDFFALGTYDEDSLDVLPFTLNEMGSFGFSDVITGTFARSFAGGTSSGSLSRSAGGQHNYTHFEEGQYWRAAGDFGLIVSFLTHTENGGYQESDAPTGSFTVNHPGGQMAGAASLYDSTSFGFTYVEAGNYDVLPASGLDLTISPFTYLSDTVRSFAAQGAGTFSQIRPEGTWSGTYSAQENATGAGHKFDTGHFHQDDLGRSMFGAPAYTEVASGGRTVSAARSYQSGPSGASYQAIRTDAFNSDYSDGGTYSSTPLGLFAQGSLTYHESAQATVGGSGAAINVSVSGTAPPTPTSGTTPLPTGLYSSTSASSTQTYSSGFDSSYTNRGNFVYDQSAAGVSLGRSGDFEMGQVRTGLQSTAGEGEFHYTSPGVDRQGGWSRSTAQSQTLIYGDSGAYDGQQIDGDLSRDETTQTQASATLYAATTEPGRSKTSHVDQEANTLQWYGDSGTYSRSPGEYTAALSFGRENAVTRETLTYDWGSRAESGRTVGWDGDVSSSFSQSRSETGQLTQVNSLTESSAAFGTSRTASATTNDAPTVTYTDPLGGGSSGLASSTRSTTYSETGSYTRTPQVFTSDASFSHSLSLTAAGSASGSRGVLDWFRSGSMGTASVWNDSHSYSESGTQVTSPTGVNRTAKFDAKLASDTWEGNGGLGSYRAPRSGFWIDAGSVSQISDRSESGNYTQINGVANRSTDFNQTVKVHGLSGMLGNYSEDRGSPGAAYPVSAIETDVSVSDLVYTEVGTYASNDSSVLSQNSTRTRTEESERNTHGTTDATIVTDPQNGHTDRFIESVRSYESHSEQALYVHDASGKTTSGQFQNSRWNIQDTSFSTSASYSQVASAPAATPGRTSTTVGNYQTTESARANYSYTDLLGNFSGANKDAFFFENSYRSATGSTTHHFDVTHTGYANLATAPSLPPGTQTGHDVGDTVETELVENRRFAVGHYSAGPAGLINRPYGFYRTEDFTSARDERFSGNALERAQPGPNDPNPMPRVWDAEAQSWQPIASLGEDAPSGRQQAAPYNANGEVESMTTSYSQTEVANSTRSHTEWGTGGLQSGWLAETGSFRDSDTDRLTGNISLSVSASFTNTMDFGDRSTSQSSSFSSTATHRARGGFTPSTVVAPAPPAPGTSPLAPQLPTLGRVTTGTFNDWAEGSSTSTASNSYTTNYVASGVTNLSKLDGDSSLSTTFTYSIEDGSYTIGGNTFAASLAAQGQQLPGGNTNYAATSKEYTHDDERANEVVSTERTGPGLNYTFGATVNYSRTATKNETLTYQQNFADGLNRVDGNATLDTSGTRTMQYTETRNTVTGYMSTRQTFTDTERYTRLESHDTTNYDSDTGHTGSRLKIANGYNTTSLVEVITFTHPVTGPRTTTRTLMNGASVINTNETTPLNPPQPESNTGAESESWMTAAHLVLAGIGMADVALPVAIAADLADAALSLYEGDYWGAGLSVIASAPGLGLVAGVAKLTRVADLAASGVRAADALGGVARGSEAVGGVARVAGRHSDELSDIARGGTDIGGGAARAAPPGRVADIADGRHAPGGATGGGGGFLGHIQAYAALEGEDPAVGGSLVGEGEGNWLGERVSSEWLILAGVAAIIGVVGKREFDRRARQRRDLDNLADALFNGVEDDDPWKGPDGDSSMRDASTIDGEIVEALAEGQRSPADHSRDACFAELSPPFKGGAEGGRVEGSRDACFALTVEKEPLGTWRVLQVLSPVEGAGGGWWDERTRPQAARDRWFNVPAAPSSRGGRIWLMSFGLIAAFCLFRGLGSLDSTAPKRVATSAGSHGKRLPSGLGSPLDQFVPTRIDEIRPGRKVLGENPTGELDESLGLDVVPAEWRLVDLVCPKRDGSWADVSLLRPIWWLEQRHAVVGGTIEVAVPECGIEGAGQVLAISACPPIRAGPGRIVTGTFRHHAAKVIELFVEGLGEPIGTTVNHPFWSIDRQQFVRADGLQTGERLRSFDDESASGATARVLGARPLPGEHTVYNLEVQGSHVYHVAASGILVHNGGLTILNPCFTPTSSSTALVPRSTVDLGKWGEARLANVLGNAGVKPAKAFKTILGNRFVDRLVNNIAHEAKGGVNVGLKNSIRLQALKDYELIKSGRIDGAQWHFFQGAQRDLLDFLTEHGIQYTVY